MDLLETHKLAMVLYAVLFISAEPIPKSDIITQLKITEENLSEGVSCLKNILESHSPIEIQETATSLVLRTTAEYSQYIEAITKIKKQKPKRLSEAAMETLAIIAYRQPITKTEIDSVRGGSDSEKTLSTLIKYGLIKIIGNLRKPGEPMLYQTTEKFLLHFNLKSLSDLPSMEEVNERFSL